MSIVYTQTTESSAPHIEPQATFPDGSEYIINENSKIKRVQ